MMAGVPLLDEPRNPIYHAVTTAHITFLLWGWSCYMLRAGYCLCFQLELQEIRQETENEVEFNIAEEWAMDNEDATLLSKRNYFSVFA